VVVTLPLNVEEKQKSNKKSVRETIKKSKRSADNFCDIFP